MTSDMAAAGNLVMPTMSGMTIQEVCKISSEWLMPLISNMAMNNGNMIECNGNLSVMMKDIVVKDDGF